jgi:hypothetical protein
MVGWCQEENLRAKTYWDQLPWKPVDVVLAEWLHKLESLEWIPQSIFTGLGGQPDPPEVFGLPAYFTNRNDIESLRGTPLEWQIQKAKDGANLHLLAKKLYQDHGWPDSFRGAEFESSVEVFREKYSESDPIAHADPDEESEEDKVRRKREAGVSHSKFLREWAGEVAI